VPRAGLSTARVVEEAAAVADELGWDRLRLAAVAERLGVRLPSLYKHIESLDALRAEVSALATRELAEVMSRAAVGRAGRDALTAIADAYRDYARRSPGRYAATVAAPGAHAGHIEAAAAVMTVVEAVLAGYHLTGDDAVDAARALRATVHGFVHLEANSGFGLPADVDRSFRRLVDGLHTTMTAWADGRTAETSGART